jgi:hypothetical protein
MSALWSSLLQLGGCELAGELAGRPTVRALSVAGRVPAVSLTSRAVAVVITGSCDSCD